MQIIIVTALIVAAIIFGEWAMQLRRRGYFEVPKSQFRDLMVTKNTAEPEPTKSTDFSGYRPPEGAFVIVRGHELPNDRENFDKMVALCLYDEEYGHYIQRVRCRIYHDGIAKDLDYYVPIRGGKAVRFERVPVLKADLDAEAAIRGCRETIRIWNEQITNEQITALIKSKKKTKLW